MKKEMTRRSFVGLSGLGALSVALSGGIPASSKSADKLLLYAGTYTNSGKSKGIYVLEFDLKKGTLTPRHVVDGVAEPSFLAIAPDRKHLYAVNELVEFDGKPSGSVSAFAIDATGNLKFVNRQPSLGGAPCFISITANGRFALVANYVGGNLAILPISKDGSLGTPLAPIQHTGSGPNRDRQLAPHAHSFAPDAANRFALAADLGTDRLMIYGLDAETGKLVPGAAQASFAAKPGAGPRHFAFHPAGRHVFLINELSLSITSLNYDAAAGTLTEIETVPTLPAGASATGASCADIHVSPNGKFVYGSNRGHNSIVVYRFDAKTGKLSLVGHVATGGKRPRNFAIDPTGRYLLAANQDSDSIVVFRIDGRTGKPVPTGQTAAVPVPVCLKFMEPIK